MSNQDSDDGIFTFVAALFLGLLAGSVLGVLFAPKSGDELRADLQDVAKNLPGKLNDEFRNPNAKTRTFIDRTRYGIENQMGKVKSNRDAGRMAKAKEAEEAAGGYDYN